MSLQVEGENDEQSSTDQVSAIKTKNVFIAQNVASLQELGKTPSSHWFLCLQNSLSVLLPDEESGIRERLICEVLSSH